MIDDPVNALRQQLNTITAPRERVETLLELCSLMENTPSEGDAQLALIHEAESLAKAHNDTIGLLWARVALTRWHYRQSDFGQAMLHAEEIVPQMPADVPLMHFKVSNIIANIHATLGNHLAALETMQKLVQHCRAHSNLHAYLGMILGNIAAIFIRLESWEHALKETLKAIAMLESVHIAERGQYLLNLYENLSYIYYHLGDGENAFRSAQEAIANREQSGMPIPNSTLMLLGNAHTLLGNFDKAEQYLLDARSTQAGMRGAYGQGWIDGSLGELYARQGRHKEALAHLESALVAFESLKTPYETANAHLALYRFNKTLEHFDRALAHHESYNVHTRHYLNSQSETILKMAETMHALETARLEHKAEEERNQALQRELEERKLAEQRALELALEREKIGLLATFIEHTSHDIRTPLAIINTSAYLMSKADSPEKRASIKHKIEEQTAHLTNLIVGMQTMVKVDAQHAFMFAPVAIFTLLNILIESIETQAKKKHQTLTKAMPQEILYIQANEELLAIALQEILKNALIYTPEGGSIHLTATQDADTLIITVQDGGIGIHEKDLPRLFERFYKVDTARQLNKSGAGFGLSIAKRIVEAHHGTIEVMSTYGEGTTFSVTLPIKQPTQKEQSV